MAPSAKEPMFVSLSSESSAAPLPSTSFKYKLLSQLPFEIQYRIWKHSVPDPRSIERGIVPIIFNYDLDHPRAIVPDESLFKEAHARMLEHFKTKTREGWQRPDGLKDPDPNFWEAQNTKMRDQRKPITDLLQFGPAARRAVFKIYCFESNIGQYEQRKKPLWKDSDVVWIHDQGARFDDWVVRAWCEQGREKGCHPYASFCEIKRLALSRDYLAGMAWDKTLSEFLRLLTFYFDHMGAFPMVESVYFLLDPDNVSKMMTGTFRLRSLYKEMDRFGKDFFISRRIKWCMSCRIEIGLDPDQMWGTMLLRRDGANV